MKRIIDKIINTSLKNVDVYQRNGSIWVIMTKDRKWIMEYTSNKTLWYNYHHFKQLFMLASETINNENLISVKEWFETNVNDNKPIPYIEKAYFDKFIEVDDVIKYGDKIKTFNV